jgi:hypothetical protein
MARRTDEEYFLEALPTDGQRKGNYRVMEDLGWDEDKYWRVRDRLYDEGKIVLGRGQGGSVARTFITPPTAPLSSTSPQTPVASAAAPLDINSEYDLYEPLANTLRAQWARFRRLDNFEAAITAHQGRRQTNGTWTRPDITGSAYADTHTFKVSISISGHSKSSHLGK